jgi:hypothetical protein
MDITITTRGVAYVALAGVLLAVAIGAEAANDSVCKPLNEQVPTSRRELPSNSPQVPPAQDSDAPRLPGEIARQSQ